MKKQYILNIYIIFFGLTFSHFIQAQSELPWLEQWDVLHYNYTIHISDDNDEIMGEAKITVKMLEDGHQLMFNLENIDNSKKGMITHNITDISDNSSLMYTHRNNKLIINILAKNKGDTISILIKYSGIPKDGLIISKNQFDNRTFFADNWPNRARHWIPCIDHPSEKATVQFNILAPSHYKVVGNGLLSNALSYANDMTMTQWNCHYPISSKVMVFAAAEFSIYHDTTYLQHQVSSWVYPENRKDGFSDYRFALQILSFYDSLIAEYPFSKLANVQSTTRYGGMENASCIFYSEKSVNGKGDHEDLMAHEISHQWFGNTATEKTWQDLWLSEGFATYLTDVYIGHKYGDVKMQNRMDEERTKAIRYSHIVSHPIIDTVSTDLNKLLNPNTYQKAAWVLHMLRNKMGDRAFWNGIRSYYNKFIYDIATSRNFQDEMQKYTDINLSIFFDQWLRKSGHPKIKMRWKQKKQKLYISLKQIQEGHIFEFPIDIKVKFKNQAKSKFETIFIQEKQTEFSLDLQNDDSVKEIILDPMGKLFFEH